MGHSHGSFRLLFLIFFSVKIGMAHFLGTNCVPDAACALYVSNVTGLLVYTDE